MKLNLYIGMRKFSLLVITVFFVGQLVGQELTLSPYSRYGVGDILLSPSSRNMAMGGLSVAVDNHFSINPSNPASYGDAYFTTLDLAGFSQYSNLKTDAAKEDQFSAGFQNIGFVFPSSGPFVLSFGFSPYSVVGYNIIADKEIVQAGETLTSRIEYEGSGGLNQLYVGGAYKLLNGRLKLGLQANYLFGITEYNRKTGFVDNALFTSSVTIDEEIFLAGLSGKAGIIYTDSIGTSGTMIRVGGLVDFNTKLNGTRRFITGNIAFRDTLVDESGSANIPARFGGGIHFAKVADYSVGIDFTYQNWANFESISTSSTLGNEWRISLGGEWVPDFSSPKYHNRIAFRMGAYYKQSYITYNEDPVNDVGLTFGIGLPPGQSGTNQFNQSRLYSRFNFSFALGRRGNLNSQPLEELYARLQIGISLNDRWFVKRVVD